MHGLGPIFWLLVACRPELGDDRSTPAVDEVVTTDTACPELAPPTTTSGFLWVYQTTAMLGSWTVSASEDDSVAIDGVTFGGSFVGPTLVMEEGHDLLLQLTNRTDGDVWLDAPGLEVTASPCFGVGRTALFGGRSVRGAGVTLWSADSAEAAGLAGLVVVRDFELLSAVQPEKHLNVVIWEVTPQQASVVSCEPGGSGRPDDCVTEPVAPGTNVLVLQTLTQVFEPDLVFHGGPPNEFLTTSLPTGRMTLVAGEGVWLNVYNQTNHVRTLDLGSLPLGPGGTPAGEVVLQPRQGVSLAGVPTNEEEVVVRCVDCPEGSVDEVVLAVAASGSGG